MYHYKTGKARDPEEAAEGFRRVWGEWVDTSYRRHASLLPNSRVDQADLISGWMSWLKVHPEHPGRNWVKHYRDVARDYMTRQGFWWHGYWTLQGIGVGMPYFTRFLADLRELDPDDAETERQVLDAAEHLGNWVSDVPAWFDWDTGLFRSVYLGTRGARDAARFPYNIPEHLRAVELALNAFRVSGDLRYLELAVAHGGRWADAIVESNGIPVALDGHGGVVRMRRGLQENYQVYLGENWRPGDDLSAAETILAHGGVGVFLKLWQLVREDRFLVAAERVLDTLREELVDVDAGVLCGAIRSYRNYTGRVRYDDDVLQVAEYLCPYLVESQSLDVNVSLRGVGQMSGVGKSVDMPGWRENGQLRQHNPVLLGLAAEISGNDRLAACAIELAKGYLVLARKIFSDGQHGGARTVSAVLCGHGRENGVGMLTGVLLPLEDAFCRGGVSRTKKRTNPPFSIRRGR